jgi:hypothetical protein
MSLTMSNTHSQSRAAASSSDALPRFPDDNERASFPDWLTRAEIFFTAKGMIDVVEHPVMDMPELKNGVFAREDSLDYLGLDDEGNPVTETALKAIVKRSNLAFNYITQSLPDKHLEVLKSIYIGNAYVLMNRLKGTFGVIKSAVSTVVLYQKLANNRKSKTESMNDYFSRIDSMLRDLQNMSADVDVSLKKFYVYNGLQADPEWSRIVALLTQMDMNSSRSIEDIKTHLINQEDQMRALKANSDTSNHHDTNNNTESHKALASSFNSRGQFRGRSRASSYRHSRDGHQTPPFNHRSRSRIIFGAVGLEAEAAQLFAAAIAADHRIHWIHLLCVTHAISLVMSHLNVGLAYSVMRAASWAIMRMIVSNESGKVVIVILSNIMQIFRHRLHRTSHLMIPHNVANAIVLWLSHHIHHPWHYIP